MLQDIGRSRILKRDENLDGRRSTKQGAVHLTQDYEDIGGRHVGKEVVDARTNEGQILKREENLDLKRSAKEGENHLMQEGIGKKGDVASRATEGTCDTFEWVDFKRNGEL